MANAIHSIQNNLFLLSIRDKSIANIDSIIGIIVVPVTIFQIIDNIEVIVAPAIWYTLSDPKYLGFNPTTIKAITDKKGKN